MMGRFTRNDPLPDGMQGDWVDAEDEDSPLTVSGGEVQYQGKQIAYDFYEVSEEDGALTVQFGVSDPARQDEFDRENLTGLVIDPDGELLGYNTRFGCQFVRKEAV